MAKTGVGKGKAKTKGPAARKAPANGASKPSALKPSTAKPARKSKAATVSSARRTRIAAAAKTMARGAGHPKKLPAAGSAGAAMLARVREICAALPETKEVEAWGHPTFRVADKIFAGFGNDEGGGPGVVILGVKMTMDMQAAFVSSDPRFSIAKYVGKHGWVSLRLSEADADDVDWGEIDALIRGSYRLIAPSKLVQKLDESAG